LSRLTNTLKTLAEVNGQCWKGPDCDLSEGVRQGIDVVAAHTQRQADLLELRVCVVFFYSPPVLIMIVDETSVWDYLSRLVCCCRTHWKV
jgi:hypothetical protein